MTILGGIYSRSHEQILDDNLCSSLRKNLSRHIDEQTQVFKGNRIYLAKVDIAAYKEAGWIASEQSIAILAGEPLLANFNKEQEPRSTDLSTLKNEWDKGNWSILNKSQGVFACAYYSKHENELVLVSDKIGIRPLYYWESNELIIFASALRIFEALNIVPLVMDLKGASEIASLGVALGKKTQYKNIYQMEPGEIIKFKNKNSNIIKYWHWNGFDVSKEPIAKLAKEGYWRFNNAIDRRIQKNESAIAFLSGGMDSRCITALLMKKMQRVYTFNFSRPNSQDAYFANRFAEKAGSVHTSAIRPIANPDWSKLMAEQVFILTRNNKDLQLDRPNVVWSGDGGSVCLGHVHLSQKIVDYMRSDNVECAVNAFLMQERYRLPLKIFRKEIVKEIKSVPRDGIIEELNKNVCDDPAKSFYLFLLLNDQRKHCYNHFENIDLNRIELLLPFFDSDFIELILQVPIEECLYHKYYSKFFHLFPECTYSVGWQTYPGHEPCPLGKSDYPGQFDKDVIRYTESKCRRNILEKANFMVKEKSFSPVIDRRKFIMCKLATQIGLRNYDYVIETVELYSRILSKCDGNWST